LIINEFEAIEGVPPMIWLLLSYPIATEAK